jgi:phage tail-like protein
MAITLETLISSLSINEVESITVSGDVVLILRDPEPSESGIALDSTVKVRIVDLSLDPATAPAGSISAFVFIDQGEGFDTAYNGSFQAPWDGPGSIDATHSPTDPYVFRDLTLDQSPGLFDSEEVISVRVLASGSSGWGHFPWLNSPWGNPAPEDGALDQTYQFTTADLTPPKLLSASAIDQYTVRLTFDDAMRSGTVDGKASVTNSTSETWDFSTGGETLQIKLDNGSAVTITFLVNMWLDPSAVTAIELSDAISALLDGGHGEVSGSGIKMFSDTAGDTSAIQVVGGTANALIGFPTDVFTGQSTGALEIENYSITRHNVYPNVAVHLDVTAVEFADDTQTKVDLTCQWEMTPNAPYVVTVDNDIADTSDNVIDPGFLAASFSGFQPDWPIDRDAIIKMPRRTWDRDSLDVQRAIINMYQEVYDLQIVRTDDLWNEWNVDTTSEKIVDLMLYDSGNPFDWTDLVLSLDDKRKLIDILPDIYQLKGTSIGIEETIEFLLGINVETEENMSEGWRLGEDEIGNSYPAEIFGGYEFFTILSVGTINISIDGGDVQEILLDPSQLLPSAAVPAETVADAINLQLIGGYCSVHDDGSGKRLLISSLKEGIESQVEIEGGIHVSTLGFVVGQNSRGGGCMLGPGDSKTIRTFDLVYSDVVPSETERDIMRRIAEYMKCVNEHVGLIRPERTLPAKYWELGVSRIGEDTVAGI